MNGSKAFKIALVLFAAFVLAFAMIKQFRPPAESEMDTSTAIENLVVTPIKAEDILGLVKARGGRVSVVNMWATFCQPCREEFPFFLRALKEYRDQGMELFFVSLDFQSEMNEVRSFLSEQRVDFETYIKNQRDGDFIKAMHPEWSGAIPITLIYNENAELVEFIPKALTFEQLEEKINSVLNSKN